MEKAARFYTDGGLMSSVATSRMTEILLSQSRQTVGAELLASKYLSLRLISHSSAIYEGCSPDTNFSVNRCLHKAYWTSVFCLMAPAVYLHRDLLQAHKYY